MTLPGWQRGRESARAAPAALRRGVRRGRPAQVESPSREWPRAGAPQATSQERGANMEIRTVGVVGAGVMGSGVGQNLAQTGHQVVLVDISDEILDRAREEIRKNLRF